MVICLQDAYSIALPHTRIASWLGSVPVENRVAAERITPYQAWIKCMSFGLHGVRRTMFVANTPLHFHPDPFDPLVPLSRGWFYFHTCVSHSVC